jgi:hypothetical protein
MSANRGYSGSDQAPSDRSFGLVFAAALLALFLGLIYFGYGLKWWALLGSGAFFIVSLLAPAWLRGLNLAWAKFGLLLHAVVNPVLLGVIFFLVVTPTALLMRLFGKDPLRLRLDRAADSYWIKREPAGPDPDSLPRQF